MSSVSVLNIIPKNPITKFTDTFSFEIIIEVLSELKKEIEWKMVYITSENQKDDQILNEIEIDPPNQLGQMKFEFVGDAPDITKIPENDVVGVAAILLCCSYNEQEFFRCGYYLNNLYDNEEMNLNPPEKVDQNRIIRSLLADKPRITRFDIEWDNGNNIIINNENKENENFMFKEGKMDIQQFNLMKDDKAGEQTTENTN